MRDPVTATRAREVQARSTAESGDGDGRNHRVSNEPHLKLKRQFRADRGGRECRRHLTVIAARIPQADERVQRARIEPQHPAQQGPEATKEV
jgi:hypothetical protein